MKIELNAKVVEQLRGIYYLTRDSHTVPQTAYFPFIVCFEWVNNQGEPVRQAVQRKRIKLCEAYNLYLQDGEAGSFERLKICLENLLVKLKDLGY